MLKLEKIGKEYKDKWNKLCVLKDLDLYVEQGEFICIYGKSGCGKSTLLNIMGLLDDYTFGNYFIDGEDTKDYNMRQISLLRNKKFGFIFQSFHLISEMSVLENGCMPLGYAGVGRKEREARAKELLNDLGVGGAINKYPLQISGGEKQRVAIARAISNSPSVILADEPTGNLDEKNGLMVMEKLKIINDKGVTVIMVTHDKSLAKFGSRVLQMADGKFV
ncbi:MAG: ABC transporter ATP-binding protein [Tissierellia bacterium]|nr:ABC transporter ATP-binding protein [Tissierellia bacterium]